MSRGVFDAQARLCGLSRKTLPGIFSPARMEIALSFARVILFEFGNFGFSASFEQLDITHASY
jgi:hypothetical protein